MAFPRSPPPSPSTTTTAHSPASSTIHCEMRYSARRTAGALTSTEPRSPCRWRVRWRARSWLPGFPTTTASTPRGYARTVGAVLRHVNGVRRFGSAALDLAWVACGRYEAYWELRLAPWDQAAGILLVREAGGSVTDPSGRDSVPSTPMVVASNSTVHNELCDIITGAMPDHLK